MKPLRFIGRQMQCSVSSDPIRWLVAGVALLLLFLLGWRALAFVDNYDGAFFHLPYAARIAGICGSDCLQLIPFLEYRFEHIPKFGHYLFAAVWLLTGSASAAGLVNFFSLILLIAYLRFAFRVDWGLAALALIAIPFVRIGATNFSPDLLPNVLVALGLFTVLDYILNPQQFTRGRAVFGVVVLAAASATKLQVYPVAIMAVCVFAGVMLCRHFRGIHNAFSFQAKPAARLAAVALVVVVLAVVSSWQIRNAVVFGNPLYPVSVTLLGVELPGRQMDRATLSAQHVDHSPLVRWAASVFEYRAYDQRPWPWSSAQGHVSHDAWSFRIGGFYGIYVLLLMLFIATMLKMYANRLERWKTGVFLSGFTVFFMLLPASYYLRYNIWWMLLLTGSALIVAERVSRESRARDSDVVPLFRGTVGVCCLAGLLASGFVYVTPGRFLTVESWVIARGTSAEIADYSSSSDVICQRTRLAIYYARVFHEGAQHRTVQLHPVEYANASDDVLRERHGCTYIAR